MDLKSCNNRHKEYNEILKQIEIYEDVELNTSGKLIFCLIEFREMIEIKYVVNAIFASYSPSEIGLAIVYGNLNSSLVEKTFQNYTNIQLIKYDVDNMCRGSYSALLKTPEFYEQFTNWHHLVVYQTDALLFRKIDDVYFQYDYIGAPWILSNQWCKYNAGNGGFSLRNIKSCIKVCESNRNKHFLTDVHRGNEDGFFCSQDTFTYPPVNTPLHKAFSVERVNYPTPVGCHQIFHNFSMNNEQWKSFLDYMSRTLLSKEKPPDAIDKLIEESRRAINQTASSNKTSGITANSSILEVEQLDKLTKIPESENNAVNINSLTIKLTHTAKNRWTINSLNDYQILLCKEPNIDTVVKSYHVSKTIEGVVHKKSSGVYKHEDKEHTYVIFYPGFPNGGESWADITACGNYNHCRELPKNGAIIIKSKKILQSEDPAARKQLQEEFLRKQYEQSTNPSHQQKQLLLQKNVLAFDLFTGVGYYNQLFSLECAIYLAYITKRYLIINIQHPLVACGKPDRNYGTIFDYLPTHYEKFLVGYEIRKYTNYFQPHQFELQLPSKFSSLVFVDSNSETGNSEKVSDFVNGRQVVKMAACKQLFDMNSKLVYIKKSNASRIFYNFYTSADNYKIMNSISQTLSKNNEIINHCASLIKSNISLNNHSDDINVKYKNIGVHLRLGDWHKQLNIRENDNILSNLNNWFSKHVAAQHTIYIMTDKHDPKILETLKSYNIVFTDHLITAEISTRLSKHYKNVGVASFLIQKQLLESCEVFIGTQGSTVSVHIQYMNFLNSKPHELHTTSSCISYDKDTLQLNATYPNKSFTWKQKNYMGGHPMAWSIFFPDNVTRKPGNEPDNDSDMESEMESDNEYHHDQSDCNKLDRQFPTVNNDDIDIILDNATTSSSRNCHKLNADTGEPFLGVDFWCSIVDILVTKPNMHSYINDAFMNFNKPIIGIKTDLFPTYANYLCNLPKPYILVTTSNDDHCPPFLQFPNVQSSSITLDINKLLENPHLIVWYAKNPGIIHYKIKPYIIGPKWQWKTTQFNGESKLEHLDIFNRFCLTPQANMLNKTLKKNLLYFNFLSQTTGNPLYSPHKNLRNKIKNELSKRFAWNNHKPFAEYIAELSTYKFCVAPPGRGIDTHRCWEALMVGTIPLVESSTLNDLYINLPVIIVSSWTHITPEYLQAKHEEMVKTNYNFNKIYSCYWLNEINKLIV